jgi:hypothetical protein
MDERQAQLQRRVELLRNGPTDADWKRWAVDPCGWIDDVAWIGTPHDTQFSRQPMILWPYQRETVPWLLAALRHRQWRYVAKARDMGATWICLALLVWLCRFRPGFSAALVSYKKESVAKIGDPDALVSKLRFIVSMLPEWMGCRVSAEPEALVNFGNGSWVAARWGDDPARGGRVMLAIWDEVAACMHQDQMAASLGAATHAAWLLSTFSAPGNWWHQQTRNEHVPVRFWRWDMNPRHTQAWFVEQQRRINNSVLFAREILLDAEASVAGQLIRAEWIDAAIATRLPAGARVVGYDPAGDGECDAVAVVRAGHVVTEARVLHGDSRQRARAVRDLGGSLAYDSSGGWGITTREECPAGIPVLGNDAVPAWLPAGERCANLRAALYWRLRWRLENTWRRTVGGEAEISPESCIQLPNDSKLRAQLLSIVIKERNDGTVYIESKAEMARRGIASPDYADALMYSEAASLFRRSSSSAQKPAGKPLASMRM